MEYWSLCINNPLLQHSFFTFYLWLVQIGKKWIKLPASSRIVSLSQMNPGKINVARTETCATNRERFYPDLECSTDRKLVLFFSVTQSMVVIIQYPKIPVL